MVKVLNREAIQRMNGRGAGSGGSGGSSEGGGGISLAQVDAAYVSKEFFNQLFTVHGKRTVQSGTDMQTVWQNLASSGNQQINASHMTEALNGYATQQWVGQQGYLTSSALNGYATKQWVQQQGYLTSHQSVDGTFWGKSWSNHGSVTGDMTNVGRIFQTGNFTLMNYQGIGLMIEGSAVTGSEYRATFGFHQEGAIAWLNNNYVMQLKANTDTGEILLHINNGILQIGDARLVWDSANNALKVVKEDGTAANLYATGGVSALGMSAGVSQLDAMTFNHVTINNNLEFGAASRITHAVTNDDRTLYIGNSDNSGWVALQDVCSQRGESYWKIMANGEAFFAEKVQSPKFYLDSTRYLYINGGTLYYFNGSTSRQIAFA